MRYLKNPLDQQHLLCPKNGWYQYWRNKEKYRVERQLTPKFKDNLKQIFTRLKKDILLDWYLIGLTENQNQSINNLLWSKCPKINFGGREKLELAVTNIIPIFNSGSGSRGDSVEMCGIKSVGRESQLPWNKRIESVILLQKPRYWVVQKFD